MLLMIKNHLNGTWFYELSDCHFRVHFKVTNKFIIYEKTQYINYFLKNIF